MTKNRKAAPQSLPANQRDEFLRSIFGEDWPRAYLTGFPEAPDSLDPSTQAGRDASKRAWAGGEFAGAGRKLVNEDRNNYLCISTFFKSKHERARRRRELHDKTFAIMVDDVGQKVDPAQIAAPPTFAIRTSEGSSQYWYVLSTPCADANLVDALVNGLVADGLSVAADPGMKGVTRFGRLPFGINNKRAYGKPWRVGFDPEHCDWRNGRRYSIDELAAAFKIDLSKVERRSRETLAPDGVAELEQAILGALGAEGIDAHGPYGDSRRYQLSSCLWAADHTGGKGEAHLFGPTESNGYSGGYKCFHGHCAERGIRDVIALLRERKHVIPEPRRRFREEDFVFVGPQNSYLWLITGEFWREEALDKALPWPVEKHQKTDKSGKVGEVERKVKPSRHIAMHSMVSQMTWLPGHPKIIADAALDDNGNFIPMKGAHIVNLYTAPRVLPGDPAKAQRWIDHIKRLYPGEADFFIGWCAHRVQRPNEKVNNAPVLGGPPGIGKDSVIEPVVWAVGVGNTKEIGPTDLWSDFNDYVQAVIVRVSESHDLGEHSRHAFYERTKRILATPPHVFDVNSKYAKKYRIKNVAGVIFTSNHEGGGLYIPEDDRRYFVLWTDVTQADFPAGYFKDLWLWYLDEGFRHIAAYLRAYDLSGFDPKGNPPKTASFLRVALSNARHETTVFREIVDMLAKQRNEEPLVLTFDDLIESGKDFGLLKFDEHRKNAMVESIKGKGRVISEIMRGLGYAAVLRRPPGMEALRGGKVEQRWKIGGRLQTIYGRIGADPATLRAKAFELARDEREKEVLAVPHPLGPLDSAFS